MPPVYDFKAPIYFEDKLRRGASLADVSNNAESGIYFVVRENIH